MGAEVPFKRGDVVEYSVEGIEEMQYWAHLNGRIGVVERALLWAWDSTPGSVVKWITQDPGDGENSPYPNRLLRCIGHIELPPPAANQADD